MRTNALDEEPGGGGSKIGKFMKKKKNRCWRKGKNHEPKNLKLQTKNKQFFEMTEETFPHDKHVTLPTGIGACRRQRRWLRVDGQ